MRLKRPKTVFALRFSFWHKKAQWKGGVGERLCAQSRWFVSPTVSVTFAPKGTPGAGEALVHVLKLKTTGEVRGGRAKRAPTGRKIKRRSNQCVFAHALRLKTAGKVRGGCAMRASTDCSYLSTDLFERGKNGYSRKLY